MNVMRFLRRYRCYICGTPFFSVRKRKCCSKECSLRHENERIESKHASVLEKEQQVKEIIASGKYFNLDYHYNKLADGVFTTIRPIKLWNRCEVNELVYILVNYEIFKKVVVLGKMKTTLGNLKLSTLQKDAARSGGPEIKCHVDFLGMFNAIYYNETVMMDQYVALFQFATRSYWMKKSCDHRIFCVDCGSDLALVDYWKHPVDSEIKCPICGVNQIVESSAISKVKE
jgi:hypothetical protein